MYYAGLKKLIQGIEEKRFYDIALMFLACQGYKDLSIVDGSGDGGRDVTCSRSDLRIQLSVRKDWQSKINEEATTTLNAEKRHFIYVTNRQIRDVEWQSFLANSYKQKGEVDISLCDLNKLSTTLALPGNIHKAYEKLGVIVDKKISATPKEIALSNVLLHSNEAKDLRQNIIESNIKAELFKSKTLPTEELINKVSSVLPGVDIKHNVRTIFSRLCSKSDILNQNGQWILSEEQTQIMAAAEEEYLQSIKNDIDILVNKYKLDKDDARKLVDIALEIMAKEGTLDGDGLKEIELAEFISNKIIRKKNDLYEDLSKLSIPRIKQYGKTLDHIFSTDTFDIFRALGQNSNIVMVLDSSVAMPLMFGLSFGSTKSRYGIAAAVLNDLCKEHHIKLKVPRCYLNEMATHGLKAFDFIEMHNILDDVYTREILKSSGNAYISHFSNIKKDNPDLTLLDFLTYFNIKRSSDSRTIENHIESILASFEIGVIPNIKYDPKIKDAIADKKPNEPTVIVEHDAIVCTLLKNDNDHDIGYIFATWDKVIIDIVEGLTRIFADTPSRVIDFLSMAGGAQYESEQSFNLLTSLIYIDEKKAAPLANKIEQIKTVDKAYKLKKFIDDARLKNLAEQDIENRLEDFFTEQALVDNQKAE